MNSSLGLAGMPEVGYQVRSPYPYGLRPMMIGIENRRRPSTNMCCRGGQWTQKRPDSSQFGMILVTESSDIESNISQPYEEAGILPASGFTVAAQLRVCVSKKLSKLSNVRNMGCIQLKDSALRLT